MDGRDLRERLLRPYRRRGEQNWLDAVARAVDSAREKFASMMSTLQTDDATPEDMLMAVHAYGLALRKIEEDLLEAQALWEEMLPPPRDGQ